MDDRLDKRLRALRRSAKRLQPEQGRVARRNARAAVLEQLRRLRAEIDQDYPVVRGQGRHQRKGVRAHKNPQARYRAVRKQEAKRRYLPLRESASHQLVREGIPLHTYKHPNNPKKVWFFAPMWALAADNGAERLAALRGEGSRKLRKALEARWRLGGGKRAWVIP